MKQFMEINFVDLGFLLVMPILVVVDSMHGYLQLHHALLLTSLSQFSLLVVTLRIDIFSPTCCG